MRSLLRLVSLRRLRLGPGQAARAAAAVAIGVASVVSVRLVARSLAEGFAETVAATAGRTALAVTAGDTGLDEAMLETVRMVPGVAAAAPRLEGTAYVAGSAGEVLTVLGVDVTLEREVRRYAAAARDGTVVDDPLVFLSRPDSIILTRAYAERHHLDLDDRLDLVLPQGRRTMVVRGLLAASGPAAAFGGDLAVMDYQAAQGAFARGRRLDAIDVVAAPGTDVETLAAAVRAAVGPGLRVEPPSAQVAEMAVATRPMRFLMELFSSLAVVVGMFLLYNAVAMTVTQRGREIALLRALGVTRGESVRLLVEEAVVLAGIGSGLGVAGGVGLAHLLLRPIATSFTTALFVDTGGVRLAALDPVTAALAVTIGVVTTLVATWLPARRAARYAPVAAARQGAVLALREARGALPGWGLGALALGAAITAVALRLGLGGLGPAADLAFVLGFGLLAPTAVRLALPAIAWLVRPFGALGRLAALDVGRNVERSAFTVAPLMVAVALAVVVATVLQSFRDSVGDWVDGVMRWDLAVASGSADVARDLPMPAALGAALGRFPGVARVHRFRMVHALYAGRRIVVAAFDVAPGDPCCLHFRRGDPETAYRRIARGEAVAVSEGFADKFHVGLGDVVSLPTAGAPHALPVAAVVTDFNSDQGSIAVARRLFVDLFGDDRVDQFLIDVAPGADRDAVRAEIAAAFGEAYSLVIVTSAELRADVMARIDRAFLPVNAFFVLTGLIGCLGIANALHVEVAERVRETGLLRSLGMCRGQVVRLVVLEASVLGLVGAVLGVALGAVLSGLWVAVHVRHGLGWMIDYHVAPLRTLAGVAAALLTAPLAGWLPARRAVATAPVAALAHE